MFLALVIQCMASYHRIPCVSHSCWFFRSLSLFLLDILLLGLKISPKQSLIDCNSSFCTSLLHGGLDALLFTKFSQMQMLFFDLRIPNGLEAYLTLYLPHEGCLFRLHQLTSALHNMDGIHIVALLYDHLTKIGHSCVKILAVLLWLGLDNTNCCF